jgi:hypothetical protein
MRLIKKLLLAGCLVAVLGSCKKDAAKPASVLSYKVDGVLKTFKPTAYYYADNSLLISGGEGNNAEISLYIYTNVNVEDFYFERKGDNALGSYQPGGFVSDTGKLIIDFFDGKRIRGTFEFRGRNRSGTKNITEGEFTTEVVNFTQYIQPPEGDPSIGLTRQNAK